MDKEENLINNKALLNVKEMCEYLGIGQTNVNTDNLVHTARCFSACFPVLQCTPLVV